MLSLHKTSLPRLIHVAALICAVLSVLTASSALAQDRKTPSSQTDYWSSFEEKSPDGQAKGIAGDDLTVSFWRMAGSTVLVLGLIALIAYLVRRFAPRAAGQGRTDVIHVIGTKLLGGRKSLMLVRVRGQTLLLGVTPQSIQCLTEIHEVEGEWAQPPDAASSAFDRQLGKFLSSPESTKKAS